MVQEAEVKEGSNAPTVSRSGKRHAKSVDTDPHGEKLLQVFFCAFTGVYLLLKFLLSRYLS